MTSVEEAAESVAALLLLAIALLPLIPATAHWWEHNRNKLLVSGGLAAVIAPETDLIQHVDIDLTLHGLRIVWERNQ